MYWNYCFCFGIDEAFNTGRINIHCIFNWFSKNRSGPGMKDNSLSMHSWMLNRTALMRRFAMTYSSWPVAIPFSRLNCYAPYKRVATCCRMKTATGLKAHHSTGKCCRLESKA